ncbi:hypothetical protein H6G89_05220 [Oscillatoria sp. FACHB-1407]|uniref:hypothetical protein n=1 Tax=Oscillatoria sp. FACHB-1407 TaxID=2692847 RepID=UPI00168379DF|nr:hypothetical protein [Oscillatoria sp. FACHB-1407]MBD2460439.1 hypothetical protein [Oscillatoria sp. FACHB-1407]
MRDRSDRYRVQTVSTLTGIKKRLGSYLVEAGLLTTAQLDVALNDQKMTEQMTGTRMQLGEIIAARGWVKEQTIEFLMQKVVIPERRAYERRYQETVHQGQETVRQQRQVTQRRPDSARASEQTSIQGNGANSAAQNNRRDVPIAKPLPPVNSSDDAVNWVG